MNTLTFPLFLTCIATTAFYLIPGYIQYLDNHLVKCKLDMYCSKEMECDGIKCYQATFQYLISADGEQELVLYDSTFVDDGLGNFVDSAGYDYQTLVNRTWHPFYINDETLEINTELYRPSFLVGITGLVLGVLFFLFNKKV